MDQLGKAPDYLCIPVGNAGNITAYWKGFKEYNAPKLDEKWIQETPNNVDRVLAVSHTVSDQILMDSRIVDRAVLPMPVYSVPGLLDHN